MVLEALASGLPVIGANAGGVQNLVVDGQTGFLCEPMNSKAFALATTRLLENQSLRDAFSTKARTFAKTLSWDEIFGKLVNSYDEVLRRRKGISNIA